MKRGLLVVIALLLVVSVAVIGCAKPAPAPAPAPTPAPAPAPKPETFKLVFSTGYPGPPSVEARPFARFLDEVERNSQGRITFVRNWGGALASVIEHLELVKTGIADIGVTQFGAHPAEVPLYGYEYAYMFGPNDPSLVTASAWKLWDAVPAFDELVAKQNQKMVTMFPWDSYHLISFEPIETVADLEGKVVACWGIFWPKILEAVGASGIPTPAPDRYLNLKQRLMDASVFPISADVSYKLYEVAKYYTFIDSGSVMPYSVSMNLDSWNKLPADLQKIMADSGREVSLGQGIHLKAERVDATAFLKKQGVTFFDMSPEEKAKWSSKIPDIPAQWAQDMEAKGLPGWDVAQGWVKITEEMGWEWNRAWAVR